MIKPSDIRILVVDDEVDLCEIIGERFSIFGYQVDLAFSGESAWEKYTQQKYDIVISDVYMPGMKGDDLARKIRAVDPRTPAVFFITGYTDLEKREIYSMGVDGLFSKPFDASALMTSIRKAVMPLQHRWSVPQPVPAMSHLDWSASSKQPAPIFGRGGFCFQSSETGLKEGQRVEFHFAGLKDIPEVKGKGIIRWLQPLNSGEKELGIEIEFVEYDYCRDFVSWVEALETDEYIPAPNLTAHIKKSS